MSAGLLALDAARPRERRFHAAAVELMAEADRRFAAPGGGWFDTLEDQGDLFVRNRGVYDGALPSGNAQMIHNLLTLWERAGRKGDPAFADAAVAGLRTMAPTLATHGGGMAHAVLALRRALAYPALADALGRSDGGASTGGVVLAEAGPVAVHVAADPAGSDRWVVTLEIAAGYHLNANPASAPELIATELIGTGDAAGAVTVVYPPGIEERFPLAEEPLRVYSGSVELHVQGWRAGDAPLTLRFQACTEAACLAPMTRLITTP